MRKSKKVEDKGLLKTQYLMSSPANAKRLQGSIDQMNRGEGITVDPGIFDGRAKAG